MDNSQKICVIFNPAAGKRRAKKRFADFHNRWVNRATFSPTERAGHAEELARRAAESGFDIVAAAGGDGTVHEVANGILASGCTDVCLAVVPLGSANDYAFSLQRHASTWPQQVDVGVMRAGETVRYFVCCLGLGFSGSVTAESRKIKRLQGKWLYGLATLRALCNQWKYLDLSLCLDDGPPLQEKALMISVMIGHREGGFEMAPDANLDDGWFDVVRTGPLSRFEVMRLLPKLATRGLPKDHPKLHCARCRKLKCTSRQPLAIHADGELVTGLNDEVRDCEIEILPARLTVRLGIA